MSVPPVIQIRQPAAEQVRVPVIVRHGDDPTSFPVEFALISEANQPEAGDWTAGAWGTWNATARTADAITPTIGGTGSGASLSRAHGRWALWLRIQLPSETPVRMPCYVLVC